MRRLVVLPPSRDDGRVDRLVSIVGDGVELAQVDVDPVPIVGRERDRWDEWLDIGGRDVALLTDPVPETDAREDVTGNTVEDGDRIAAVGRTDDGGVSCGAARILSVSTVTTPMTARFGVRSA
jgi:hypothetical protein